MGEIVAVVGPSGAGKDSLMRAAKREMPEIAIVQRVITRRNPDLSEDFICVSDEQFQERINSGGFAVHWKAHGLNYGIPIEVHDTLATARIVLFNGSRAALADAKIAFSGLGPRCEEISYVIERFDYKLNFSQKLFAQGQFMPISMKFHS